jgi:CO/xanthine dehydrogenase FAD-binding subunit
MILPRFDVLVPETVEEACSMLAEHSEKGVRVLAGGTDLLVDLRRPIIPQHVPRCDGCPTHPDGSVRSTIDCSLWESDPLMAPDGPLRRMLEDPKRGSPAYLVSLHRLKELKGIERLEDGGLRIGALTTVSEIERSSEIREHWEALGDGADSLGSPLVRNRGTLGGNIANARPAADTAIPTIALGGRIHLRSPSGERIIAAEEFPKGPGLSVIQKDEILTHVEYPSPAPHSGSAYYKLANRKALEISMVGVAVWLALDKPGGKITDSRVALGAVGPTPILAASAAKVLSGKVPDNNLISRAARAAADDSRPIDDHRGSAWYRLQMVELLTERMIRLSLKRASENK